jgi:hypothetical protein
MIAVTTAASAVASMSATTVLSSGRRMLARGDGREGAASDGSANDEAEFMEGGHGGDGSKECELVAALVTETLDAGEKPDLQIEACLCYRCGGARLRLYLGEYKWSGRSYLASWAELLLGRELDEHECRRMWRELVLN